MLIKKEDSKEKKNAESCIVWEYPLESKNLKFAIAKIDGRYPEEGASINEICEMIYYVIDGFGIIDCDGKSYEIKKGDLFFIKPKSKYWISGKNLLIAIPTSPPWYPEQYKQVKE